jgi:hypothetical protein
MYQRIVLFTLVSLGIFGCMINKKLRKNEILKVSENGRYLTKGGQPFFWMADTGWLLFNKLTREQALAYLEDRKQKGFNVVQAMVLHTVSSVNIYGDSALVNANVANPAITPGNSFTDSVQYDFWDHVDYVIDQAREKGIYVALVPIWGNNVKSKKVNFEQAKMYASFLGKRYRNKTNIIWLNGGDIKGSEMQNIWQIIGSTLKESDPNHLITFHPRGRTGSSEWFHEAKWLDFNMVQSGHRRYDQDTTAKEQWHFGEDNWRYIEKDYNRKPAKPTVDGEPSYEGIPQGLHDVNEPRWKDADLRRYAYWSVFAGAFGFTYGNNSVIQMYNPKDKDAAYGAIVSWQEALNDPGAGQMIHLKSLMLSKGTKSYFSRVPDQSVIADFGDGEKYNRLMATRTDQCILIYTYTGRKIPVKMGVLKGGHLMASWFNPRNGKTSRIGRIENKGLLTFEPPGEEKNGNDWVLILDKL